MLMVPANIGNVCKEYLHQMCVSVCQSTHHALITLSSNHIFSALALAVLLIADFRYRAIGMALAGCRRGEERKHIIIP